MQKMKKIYLSSPTMYGDEMKYIQEAFDTNWIAPVGSNISNFEQGISNYLSDGREQIYTTALSSGTAALHLALINEGIGQGDIVFCQDLTFAATCNPIVYQGADFLRQRICGYLLNPEHFAGCSEGK